MDRQGGGVTLGRQEMNTLRSNVVIIDGQPVTGISKGGFFPNTYRQGLHIGVYREWRLKNFLSVQTGLSYRQRGMKVTAENPLATSDQVNKLNYLSVEATLKYIILPQKSIQPYVFGGFRFDYLLASQRDQFFQDYIYQGGLPDNRYDFGPVIGIGVQSGKGKIRPFVEVEFNNGLMPATVPNSTNRNLLFNRTFGFTAGISF